MVMLKLILKAPAPIHPFCEPRATCGSRTRRSGCGSASCWLPIVTGRWSLRQDAAHAAPGEPTLAYRDNLFFDGHSSGLNS